MKLKKNDKRLIMVYVILALWLGFAVMGIVYAINFTSIAIYFLSLVGFVGTYVWGESVRKSKKSSIFQKGPNSEREILSYIVMGLWVILGIYGIVFEKPLDEMAAYYGSLTPFVGAYILGETYKSQSLPGVTQYSSVSVSSMEYNSVNTGNTEYVNPANSYGINVNMNNDTDIIIP